tara:strand:+ start:1957 stop:4308 length:2352 start_codon:yes stop_codon:yes gene_type:complete
MTIFRRFIKFGLIIVVLFLSSIFITYLSLLYKPESIFFIANKTIAKNYSFEYSEINSKVSFLNPNISVDNILIRDQAKKVVLKGDEILIGIDLIKSFSMGFIHLNDLRIDNFNFLQDSSSDQNTDFAIYIKNLYIKSNNYNFASLNTRILSQSGELSLAAETGELNNMNFKGLNIFNKLNENKYYYSIYFNLDEQILDENDLFDFSSFSDYKIDLSLYSSGFYESNSNELVTVNKYIFRNSALKTLSGYLFENINAVLYENSNKEVTGMFDAKIPEQNINGSIQIKNNDVTIYTNLEFDMSEILNYENFLTLNGKEEFAAKILISDGNTSLDLRSNLKDTEISSSINELNKKFDENLNTSIYIDNITQPTYLIENQRFYAFIGNNNNGFFSLGKGFDNEIKEKDFADGFHIYLTLKNLKINNILIPNEASNDANLKSLNLKIDELNFFNNLYQNQIFKINFKENSSLATFNGSNLNGSINIDNTGFTRIDVYNTKFEFKGLDIVESQSNFDIANINLRFVGKNIQTYDDIFQDIDFYLLRNKNITTVDNIKVSSKNLNIGPYDNNEKAYISYNNKTDMYKVRGSYKINNENSTLEALTNYDFEYLSANLNIQWIGINQLKNIEGNVDFLLKDFQSNTEIPNSAFLRALKIFNLNAIIENINNETNIASPNLYINRAEGNFYIGQNRALISEPIKIETSEAKMRWQGEIVKNSVGVLDSLNLDLEMRLKVSENIPWYAAIFGGIPALAGGMVLENIFDESLDDVSTFKFKVTGNIDNPEIERLD